MTEQDFQRHATSTRATTPQGIKSIGLIKYASNAEIDESQRRVQEARAEQTVTPIVTLSSHISGCFEENRINRESSRVERQMIDNLNQRNNEYTSEKLAAIIAQGGTKVFMGLTGVKCRAAEAWLGDVLSNHPFSLKHSPVPELPPYAEEVIVERVMAEFQRQWQESGETMTDVQAFDMASMLRDNLQEEMEDEAEIRANRMEQKVKDQMAEGNWDDAFDEFIHNMVTFKAGFIKGPILRRKKVLAFKKAAFGGKTIATTKTVVRHVYEAPSPLDIYPSDGAKNCDEGNLIERIKFTRKDLYEMKGLPGYNSAAIDLVLSDYGRGGLRSWTTIDSIRAILEDKGDRVTGGRELIEGKEFWGSVQGQLLIDHGMYTDLKGKPLEPLREYEINALQVGAYLLYVNFNPHPLGHRPYSKTGWGIVPGSFWYKGVPELMEDLQSICNATVRAMVNNLGIGSGPQVVINDINRIAKGQKVSQMYPWKIWQFINNARSQLKAIDFFQPKIYAKELMAIYDQFSMLADDYTGIPAYTYGNDRVAGAGRTARGLGMLMSSAARGVKKVIARIDREVLRPTITRQYVWNMLYDPDESIKGDLEIQPQGALASILREQMAGQRMEFLNVTANPIDQRILGIEGRGKLLREAAETMQMDDLVPDKKALKLLEIELAQERAAIQEQEAVKNAA